MERKNAVTLKGNPVTLLGEEAKVGEKAKDFTVINPNLEPVTLSDFKNKIKLIAAVPSLDTPVCDLEINKFNNEAANISKDIVIIFISMDLPFAQKRFCGTNNIKKVKTLSDHRDGSFGINYGVMIKDLRLLARAIFILDRYNTVKYAEYVSEIGNPPNYKAALAALKKEID